MREPAAASLDRIAASCLARLLEEPLAIPAEADKLAEAAADPNPDRAVRAAEALFRGVVEPLADRFEPRLSEVYQRFFSYILERARHASGFEAVDEELRAAGGVRDNRSFGSPPSSVRKAVVLSRVTLGADIAVTSVAMARLLRTYPDAEIILVGSRKAGELFASHPRIRLAELAYPRGGRLLDRLGAWLATRRAVEAETAELSSNQYVVVDPDSRLTQLGLLPVAPRESYLFFDSRGYGGDSELALGELTDRWLAEVFGGRPGDRPFAALPVEDVERGARFRESLEKPLAAVNFGFGGNPGKRLEAGFEAAAALELLRRGYAVALDCGFGEEESARSAAVLEAIEAAGFSPADVLDFQGSLSGFAGYIAAADLFVGYDSACGHIAAAVGTPGVDVFAGATSPRMRQRWRPWGERPATVIAVDPSDSTDAVLERLREALP